jgi:uncharacterized protein (DUF433 family)
VLEGESKNCHDPCLNWEITPMDLKDRITVDPKVLVGKPVVRGTRLAVKFVVGLLTQGWTEAQVLESYPGLTHEDVLACLQLSSDI